MKTAVSFVAWCAIALACHTIDGPKITGKDLAAADPVFAALDPVAIIASAPLPGVKRVLRAQELVRLLPGASAPEMCFERATRILTSDELLPLLQRALGIENARLEILDFIRSAVPMGKIEFSRAGLNDTGLWRGRVRYDENRSAPVWVKVRVSTEQTWIEAIEPLETGKPIDEAQLRLRSGSRFPFGPIPISSVEALAGRIPRRGIRAGEPIFATMVATPHEIERGEKVAVEVIMGEARLSFDAVAQSSGREGESVLIKNPESGRYFQARVESRGKVIVNR